MTKSTMMSIAGLVLALISAALIVMDEKVYAACIGLVAYFLAAFGSKSAAVKWKIWSNIFVAAVFGYALCPTGGFFCMMACILFMVSVATTRLLLFEQLGHARLKWMEAALFTACLGYYFVGNLYDGSGWLSWALPTPGLAFTGFMIMGKTIEDRQIASNAITSFGVEIGKPAPNFSLPDQDGNAVDLSDFEGKRHVLLIFVRGDWCPTCHIMLRSYEKNKERFAAKNIMLLAIGPDNVEVNKVMVEKLGLEYKLLSDTKFEAVRSYGMALHPNNPMTKYAEGIPLPASFLVDIEGNIQYTSNPRIAGEILNPETIIPVVEKLSVAALV